MSHAVSQPLRAAFELSAIAVPNDAQIGSSISLSRLKLALIALTSLSLATASGALVILSRSFNRSQVPCSSDTTMPTIPAEILRGSPMYVNNFMVEMSDTRFLRFVL